MKKEVPSPPTTTTTRAEGKARGVLRAKDSSAPKPECMNRNGVSPPLFPKAARANSVPRDTNLCNNQRARKPILLSKPKSGEDITVMASPSSQKGTDSEELKAVGRFRNRSVVEQFARPHRQRLTPDLTSNSTKRNGGDDLNGKVRKELQEKLDLNETLIRNLQSEVLVLKADLDKALRSNTELQSHNRKLSEDLAAAEAKNASLTIPHQRDSEIDCQTPSFKDVQNLIAIKLEHSKIQMDGINDEIPTRAPVAAPSQQIPVASADLQRNVAACHLPPPPPPPPPRAVVKAAIAPKTPANVQSCHSLTKHDRTKYLSGSGNRDKPVAISAHSSIVGELQQRSAHLLAIKTDIETKGELINSLIQKVMDAAFTDIEDVLKFVDWLDDQLLSLADERAVLKHFKWPEKKADAMREAAVEYRGLKLLESEFSSYKDNASIPCGVALKKMAGLLDKSEQSIQRFIKLRNSVVLSYQQYKIPTDWMHDSGFISKIKQSSMLLTKIYLKRVTMEIESIQYLERESAQEGLLLQGIYFANRAHQFAGGLDSETLCAFEEIRRRVPGHLRESQALLAGIRSPS